MNQTDFHSERLTGLGGSDAAVVLGISRYKTPYQLYKEKIGEESGFVGNEATRWGIILESVVAAEYSRRTGNKISRMNGMIRSAKFPFMIAHLDRRVLNQDGGMFLEVKTAGKFADMNEWGEDGSDEIPLEYRAQVQHYLSVTGWKRADVAALIAGQDFRVYHIERDETKINRIIEAESEFWKRVTGKNPPEPKSVEDAIMRWPKDDGTTCIADDSVRNSIMTFNNLKTSIKELEEKLESEKKRIVSAIKEKTFLVDKNGNKLATWKEQSRTSIDVKLLQEKEPELSKAFLKTSSTRVLRVQN